MASSAKCKSFSKEGLKKTDYLVFFFNLPLTRGIYFHYKVLKIMQNKHQINKHVQGEIKIQPVQFL